MPAPGQETFCEAAPHTSISGTWLAYGPVKDDVEDVVVFVVVVFIVVVGLLVVLLVLLVILLVPLVVLLVLLVFLLVLLVVLLVMELLLVVLLVVELPLVKLAHDEPEPEYLERHVEGLQCAASVSHQPAEEPACVRMPPRTFIAVTYSIVQQNRLCSYN